MNTDAVYWASFCGNRSEYDAFWSDRISLNTKNPDLTVCFQRTVLSWPPVVLLFAATPIHLWYTRTKKNSCRLCEFTWLNLVKTLICLLMIVASALMAVWVGRLAPDSRSFTTPADIVASLLRILSMLLALFITRFDHIKDVFSSGILPLFWLLSLLLEIPQCRSNVLRRDKEGLAQDQVYFIVYNAYFGALILQFLLTFLIDRPRSRTSSSASDQERVPLLHDSCDITGPDAEGICEPPPCPHLSASFWSQLTFQWIAWEIAKGKGKKITFEMLYRLRPQDRCKVLLHTFYTYFKRQGTDKRSESRPDVTSHTALWRVLFHCVSWDFGMAIVLRLVSIPITYINPQLLSMLILYVERRDPYLWKGILVAVYMLLSNIISSVFINNFLFRAFTAGMKARSIVEAVIFRKVLQLSNSARGRTSTGQVLSLMSVDAARVQDMYAYSTLLWTVPLMILLAIFFLWETVGAACLSGLGVLLILVPLNAIFLARKVYQLQDTQMREKDNRFRIMNEILSGMKVLKLYAWEPPFEEKVLGCREKELSTVKYVNYINAFGSVCWLLTPYLVTLAIFTTYILMDEEHVLSANRAFVTLALVNLLHFPLNFLPLGVAKTAQGIASIRRVSQFLDLNDLDPEEKISETLSYENRIEIEKATFSWGIFDPPTLKDISVNIPCGGLVGVVGMLGSGKTSLLNAILGEMFKRSGTVRIKGNMAYVPQKAWILHTTLRENVLFGRPFDQDRYDSVIRACALQEDLRMLPDNDLTEIGEKGVNLSGGQKQRVSLARALYQEEDVYLLDDPLSWVDSHVGKHIFDNIIGPQGLLSKKTRVLVTHAVTYLPHCDVIIVLRDGRVSDVGPYEMLIRADVGLSDIVRSYVEEMTYDQLSSGYSDDTPFSMSYESSDVQSLVSSIEWEPIKQGTCNLRRSRGSWVASRSGRRSVLPEEQETQPDSVKLVDEERHEEGTIKLSTVMAYIKACGYVLVNFVLWSHILFITSQVFTYIWLVTWTEDAPVNGTYDHDLTVFRLSVYGYLGIGQLVAAMLEAFLLAHCSYLASRCLHQNLLEKVLRAPMAFFESNPLGRIMNRFSKDVDVVDGNLPLIVRQLFFATAPVIVTVILICYSTPIIIAVFIPLTMFYIILQRLYVRVVRQWKRIDAVRQSPIYVHCDETLNGSTSIRAYGRVEQYIEKVDQLIDESQRSTFLLIAANRWCSLVMEVIGAGVIFFASLFAVLDKDLTSGMAGLSVSFSLSATVYVSSIMRTMSELEKSAVSVERIEEYNNNTPSEAARQVAGKRPADTWPEVGAVQFTAYSTRFRAGLDLVLKNIDCYIKPGEKGAKVNPLQPQIAGCKIVFPGIGAQYSAYVGIVGRTGAGKSTMGLALFRMTEAASGSIYIDGHDVAIMGLHDLRSRLSIIPQDPVVFSGSLRSNLDPFNEHDDADIWRALLHSHLASFTDQEAKGLEFECGENGEALSAGQKQLVCLARALLRKSKILVLDEATAAMDLETDALIQSTIRQKFKHCTVLTVAHRLHTVQDYDRIMVIDQGRIVEMDSPGRLLSDKTSNFYAMARDAGLV